MAESSRPGGALARTGYRNHVRPTGAGLVYLALLVGVAAAALNTGNNLLYLLLGLLCSVFLVNSALAEWNLGNVVVERTLPGEAFAGAATPGVLSVGNGRRALPAFSLHVQDLGVSDTGVVVSIVPCRAMVEAPVTWRFPRRGWNHLARVRVSSTFPFGLLRRWQDLPLPADVLVWPGRETAPRVADAHVSGAVREDDRTSGGTGDFQGLRPYREGDPVRLVHWPTTARTGTPMVTVRSGEVDDEVMVSVDLGLRGEALEKDIRRACGQADHHFRMGRAVGMALGEEVLAPRTGEAWRRHLLTRLALLPGWDALDGEDPS